MQPGDARDRDIIEKAVGAIEHGGQARGICGGGGEADQVNTRSAQRRAELNIFLWRDIDANHAIHACLDALVRKPFGPADRHRIGIAHQHQRYVRVPRAEGGGDGEDIRRRRSRLKTADIGLLDRGTIGHRIGEGHAEFDDICATRHECVEIGGGIAIARGDEGDEGCAIGREGGTKSAHIFSPRASATVKISLSPRPQRLARMIRSRSIFAASRATAAIACEGSSAGMMPSVRQSN